MTHKVWRLPCQPRPLVAFFLPLEAMTASLSASYKTRGPFFLAILQAFNLEGNLCQLRTNCSEVFTFRVLSNWQLLKGSHWLRGRFLVQRLSSSWRHWSEIGAKMGPSPWLTLIAENSLWPER